MTSRTSCPRARPRQRSQRRPRNRQRAHIFGVLAGFIAKVGRANGKGSAGAGGASSADDGAHRALDQLAIRTRLLVTRYRGCLEPATLEALRGDGDAGRPAAQKDAGKPGSCNRQGHAGAGQGHHGRRRSRACRHAAQILAAGRRDAQRGRQARRAVQVRERLPIAPERPQRVAAAEQDHGVAGL